MKYVIIIGVGDNVDRELTKILLNKDDIHLTLFLQNEDDIRPTKISNCLIIEGDVMDYPLLKQAISIQDIVYVNLTGNLDAKTMNIINAMKETGVNRIICIRPLETAKPILHPIVTNVFEKSGLEYTILTPSTNEIDYEVILN